LPNGNAMMIGWEFRSVDSRPFFAGGKKTALRADHTIDEIDPSGEVRFHWSSYDNVGLDEVIEGPKFDPTNFQVVHANSLEALPDGNVMASFRSTSSILKINRSTGQVVWRLGGKKSDFKFVDDPLSGFSRQHDPHFVPNGDLMLFDNGNQHTPPRSRVVRYALDESSHTARLTWEYRHDPDVFSEVAGSARLLPNGHVLIGWTNGLVTEIDDARKVVWEAKAGDLAIYRALYTPSLYP
jgi:outer membrane protein assembly factor BamB